MNVITRFLEHYSYRFPKGYPDVTNLEDKALLYKILSYEKRTIYLFYLTDKFFC